MHGIGGNKKMSKLPTCVVVYLTDYCKLKCKHCFLSQNNCINKNMIDFAIIKKLLLTFKENNVFMVAFTGGDPMLHPQIFEILSLTKKNEYVTIAWNFRQ